MGQYWLIVNASKKQYINSYDFKVSKMMEFAWMGDNYILAIEAMLSPTGGWYGDSVWFEGDYNQPNPDIDHDKNLYDLARESWERLSVNPIVAHKRFIINATTHQFVDINKNSDSDNDNDNDNDNASEGQIHPLPLLLACSSGGGGGDYQGTNEHLLGIWVGHRVYTDDVVPDGYAELIVNFRED